MGVTTRSKSSHRDAEERREFLEEGAAAARAAARVGPHLGTYNLEVTAPATPLAVPAEEEQERRPGASSTHDDLREAHRPFARLMSDVARDSPRSPSVEYEAALGKMRAPTQIPLEPVEPLQAVLGEEHAPTLAVQPCMHSSTQAALGKMRAPTQNPRIVTFSGTPRRAESVRSKISSTTEARRQAAELEASEQLAEIRRQQLQLEADLVKKRLETKLSQIDAEASVHDDASSIEKSERVQEWLNNSQQGDPTPQKRSRVNEAPPDYTTPKRPIVDTEQRVRQRSFVREDRDISPGPEPHTPYTTRTQEGTIAESMVHLFEKMQMAARPAPKDIYELPAFYGDVGEWRSFINTYTETARRYGFSDYENVARLRTALRGEAKACVQHVLSTATRPDLIIRILKKQFGRSEVLLDRAIDDLRRMQPVGPGAHDLNAFAIKVMNIVSTVMDLDKRHYADNPMLIREVTDRLSPHLRSRWCEYAKAHQDDEDPEILQLADFLMQESEQEMQFCHARAPTRTRAPGAKTEPSSSARPVGGRPVPVPRTHIGAARPRDSTGRSREDTGAVPKYSYSITENNCLFCGGRHSTQECRKLASKSLGERWDWARLNRICYKCMNAKHRRNHCREKGCGIAGCPHPHHKLLHGETTEPQAGAMETTPAPPPRSNESSRTPARTSSAGNPREGARVEESSHESTTTDSVPRAFTSITSHDVLLKVLPVTLTGPGGTAHIYAMLDDGSTISLLEEDIADQIGAYGPQAPLNVRGIGGIAHRSHAQTVKAVVRPARGGAAHDLILRTVSCLGLRSQTIDKERLLNYEHLRDLGEFCYTTGVPQMLIGADHWHLLVPTEVRMGQHNEPAAIKVSLGWAFFGIMPRIVHTNDQTTMHCRAYEADSLNESVRNHSAIEACVIGISTIDQWTESDQRAVACHAVKEGQQCERNAHIQRSERVSTTLDDKAPKYMDAEVINQREDEIIGASKEHHKLQDKKPHKKKMDYFDRGKKPKKFPLLQTIPEGKQVQNEDSWNQQGNERIPQANNACTCDVDTALSIHQPKSIAHLSAEQGADHQQRLVFTGSRQQEGPVKRHCARERAAEVTRHMRKRWNNATRSDMQFIPNNVTFGQKPRETNRRKHKSRRAKEGSTWDTTVPAQSETQRDAPIANSKKTSPSRKQTKGTKKSKTKLENKVAAQATRSRKATEKPASSDASSRREAPKKSPAEKGREKKPTERGWQKKLKSPEKTAEEFTVNRRNRKRHKTEEDLLRVAQQEKQSHAETRIKLSSYTTDQDRMLNRTESELHVIESKAHGKGVPDVTKNPDTGSSSYSTQLLRVNNVTQDSKHPSTRRERYGSASKRRRKKKNASTEAYCTATHWQAVSQYGGDVQSSPAHRLPGKEQPMDHDLRTRSTLPTATRSGPSCPECVRRRGPQAVEVGRRRKADPSILWSRHHSWCCVKGRLHAAATRRRAKKYCKCGKGRQFRRPRCLMFRRKQLMFPGCSPCSASYNCCHTNSPTVSIKLPSKSILHNSQITSKTNLSDCGCTKDKNCNSKLVQHAGIQNLCRFTVDAYFT